jgi:hypothetical protein
MYRCSGYYILDCLTAFYRSTDLQTWESLVVNQDNLPYVSNNDNQFNTNSLQVDESKILVLYSYNQMTNGTLPSPQWYYTYDIASGFINFSDINYVSIPYIRNDMLYHESDVLGMTGAKTSRNEIGSVKIVAGYIN